MHNNPHTSPAEFNDNPRPFTRAEKLLFAAFTLACMAVALMFSSCGSLSAGLGNGMKGLPVAATVELQGPEGTQNAWALYDGETLVAYNGDLVGTVSLVDKASLITLGNVQFTAKNQIVVRSRKRDFSAKFTAGESLPAWLTENYPAALLERYGVIVEGSTSAAEAAVRKPAR